VCLAPNWDYTKESDKWLEHPVVPPQFTGLKFGKRRILQASVSEIDQASEPDNEESSSGPGIRSGGIGCAVTISVGDLCSGAV